jgi:hypothetical protein
MKFYFKTFSDTKSLFIIRGKDLLPEQKDLRKWKIDIDFSIPGPRKSKLKKKSLILEFKVHPFIGKTPPDVTGRVREFDAEEEWVGVEVFGVVDLELNEISDINRVDAGEISIKMDNGIKAKLSQSSTFNWAIEGRLDFTPYLS